mmetsp:Transcript_13684/g.41340  ORF Transcript_13684/g.41340 Transcript_13684/m.41340 type:complete len:222 (+) Transcript_13684:529-1194(+)
MMCCWSLVRDGSKGIPSPADNCPALVWAQPRDSKMCTQLTLKSRDPARLKLAAGAVAEQLPAGAGGGGNGGGTGAGAPGAGLLDDLVIRLDPQLQRLRQLLLAHQTLEFGHTLEHIGSLLSSIGRLLLERRVTHVNLNLECPVLIAGCISRWRNLRHRNFSARAARHTRRRTLQGSTLGLLRTGWCYGGPGRRPDGRRRSGHRRGRGSTARVLERRLRVRY